MTSYRERLVRTLLSTVPKQAQGAVAAIVRTIFSQPDHATAMLSCTRWPGCWKTAAELLEDAAQDVLAHLHFPREHRRRLYSTNPLERLHKEIKHRPPASSGSSRTATR
jgi:transposase-like protein